MKYNVYIKWISVLHLMYDGQYSTIFGVLSWKDPMSKHNLKEGF